MQLFELWHVSELRPNKVTWCSSASSQGSSPFDWKCLGTLRCLDWFVTFWTYLSCWYQAGQSCLSPWYTGVLTKSAGLSVRIHMPLILSEHWNYSFWALGKSLAASGLAFDATQVQAVPFDQTPKQRLLYKYFDHLHRFLSQTWVQNPVLEVSPVSQPQSTEFW